MNKERRGLLEIPLTILACDPGLTSGLASLQSGGNLSAQQQRYVIPTFRSWECDFERLCEDLYRERDTNVELVIEKFTITNETAKKSRQYDALNIIGVFRHYSYMSDWPLTLQSPGSAKKLGTDDRLKDLGWYTPGKGHANDAARHLLLYCVNNEIITFVDDRPVFIWRRFFASGLCNASALSRKNPPGKYETW